MSRIVVNKHVPLVDDIHGNELIHKGEILICNEIDQEGIYVLNNNKQLIKVGTNLATASSAVTEDDLEALALELKTYTSNNYYTKAQTENKILELTSGSTGGGGVDEDRVLQIVNSEIDKLIDSADTNYNTLGKISNWIVNQSGSDIDYNVVNEIVDEKINELIDSADTQYDTLGKISNWIENNSGCDLTEVQESISGLTERIEILESFSGSQVISSDHYVLTYQQYNSLITNGYVIVDGQRIIYRDDAFYCLYEGDDEDEPTPIVPTGYGEVSGGVITVGDDIEGTTMICDNSFTYIDEDGHTLVIDLTNTRPDDTPSGDDDSDYDYDVEDGTLSSSSMLIDETNENTIIINGAEVDGTIITI